jgi:hypothetical protein
MKKILFFSFFILPIVAYLFFFASGVNGFTKLPTLTPNTAGLAIGNL